MLERMRREDSAEAYGLLVARTEELIAMGTGQYVAPYPPKANFDERIERGENWLLRSDGVMVGIVSVVPGGLGEEWKGVVPSQDHLWVASLFVSLKAKGQGIGDRILASCQARSRSERRPLLLDCYLDSGFLEQYYRERGFVTVATQTFAFGDRRFDAALMRYAAETL